MNSTLTQISAETYKTGLLVNDDTMSGVVALPSGTYAVFITELLSAKTTHYQEFSTLDRALSHVNSLNLNTHFEAFGCDKGSSCKGAQKGACASCSNNAHQEQCAAATT